MYNEVLSIAPQWAHDASGTHFLLAAPNYYANNYESVKYRRTRICQLKCLCEQLHSIHLNHQLSSLDLTHTASQCSTAGLELNCAQNHPI